MSGRKGNDKGGRKKGKTGKEGKRNRGRGAQIIGVCVQIIGVSGE